MINKILSCIYIFLALLISGCNAQAIPHCLKNTYFYARPVYSQGANPIVGYLDGTTQTNASNDPSFQYFLYLETNCSKSLKISSVSIDGAAYTTQLKKILSPVILDNGSASGNNISLVKKSKYDVYQLDNLRRTSPNKDFKKNAQVAIITGVVRGKSFTKRVTAAMLPPISAQ